MNKERVNIQYSIDIKELSAEVERLLSRAATIAENAHKCEFEQLRNINEKDSLSINTLTSIDLARKKLSAVDYALNDVADIVNGFLAYKVQETMTSYQQSKVHSQPRRPTTHTPQSPLDIGDVRAASVKEDGE